MVWHVLCWSRVGMSMCTVLDYVYVYIYIHTYTLYIHIYTYIYIYIYIWGCVVLVLILLFTLVGTWHGSASKDPERHLRTGQRYVRHWGKAMGGAFKVILFEAWWKDMKGINQTNVVSLLDAFCDQRAIIVLASLRKAGSRAKEVLAGTWVFNSCECRCTSLLHSLSGQQNKLYTRSSVSFTQCLLWKVKSLLSFCVPCHLLQPTHFDQDAKLAFDAPKWEQELEECMALLLLP